jgi:hypothetical protein
MLLRDGCRTTRPTANRKKVSRSSFRCADLLFNVRFWHLADILIVLNDVRFRG